MSLYKEDMNEAAKNFKKMLYDKSITEEEFNDKLNSLYEPMTQQIILRAKLAGFSINLEHGTKKQLREQQ